MGSNPNPLVPLAHQAMVPFTVPKKTLRVRPDLDTAIEAWKYALLFLELPKSLRIPEGPIVS